jgi:uncharacterized protein with PQ loop repeat
MVQESHGIHHYHKRKRTKHSSKRKRELKKFKSFLDKTVYFVALFGPIMTIPQVLKIWAEQSVAGLSLISWSAYCCVSLFWLTYGIVHREKPIIFSNVLWLITDTSIVVGILIYG